MLSEACIGICLIVVDHNNFVAIFQNIMYMCVLFYINYVEVGNFVTN